MNPRTRIRLLLAAGALASALVLPGAAGAATITWTGDTLTYTAADGEANRTGPWYGVVDESKITISDGYGITVTDATGGHCEPVADRFECDVPAKMIFDLGDGDDYMTWSDQRDIEYVVDAGEGNDEVRGFSGSMDDRPAPDHRRRRRATTRSTATSATTSCAAAPATTRSTAAPATTASRAATATTRCSATATRPPAPT